MIAMRDAILAPVAGEEAAAADANLQQIARLRQELHKLRNDLTVAELRNWMYEHDYPTTTRALAATEVAAKQLRRYRDGVTFGVCPQCGMGRTATGGDYHTPECALIAFERAPRPQGGAA